MRNERETGRANILRAEFSGIFNFPKNFVKELIALPKLFSESAKELKLLSTIVLCGFMGALSIILKMFASIPFGPFTITYAWIPNRIVDFMFGPSVGAVYGGAMDIIKFIMKPTGQFNLAYTAVAMIAGIIFGSILYKKPVSFMRIVFAQTIVKVFVNAGITTYLMAFERGEAFMVLMPARLIKNLIMIPVDSILLFIALTAIAKVMGTLKK